MNDEQIAFPFTIEKLVLQKFLDRWQAIEDEQDRLREELRLLKADEQYTSAFPMRGVLTAVKIVRARHKLAKHAKEPMQPQHLSYLEALVNEHLDGMTRTHEQMMQELKE